MPDLTLYTLVVQGVDGDIAAFRRAAKANRTSRSEGAPLSVRRLMRVLPAGTAIDEYLRRHDLSDLVVDPTRELEPGMAEVTYNFQLKWGDLEAFLVEVSRVYPRLCFILGTVFPAGDEQESCFIHDGRKQSWTLPASQKEILLADVPDDADETSSPDYKDGYDPVLWALIHADWAMLEAVVDHWAGTAAKTRAEIAASRSATAPR
jgi:hypothetical protein